MKQHLFSLLNKTKNKLLGKYNFYGLINKITNKKAHQYNNTTSFNRYPEIFMESVKLVNGETKNLKILSFGCSTGEECETILGYFPNSIITGVDINSLNINKAKSSYNHLKQLEFKTSKEFENELNKKFDLIFCMSVLCRWEDTKDVTNCNDIYPFKTFEHILVELDKRLNSNGLFIIYNSNYCFTDTCLNNNYEVISSSIKDTGFVHKYKSNGERIRSDKHIIFFKKK
ncbi:MAG: class I SAM-dependent methyltransferase [Flavobacteriales bacterium]|nr:class I SAM-dependent methyltransferase [Flavobacteriales bacterium]